MGITFNSDNKVFHIQGKETSYIMQVHELGYLMHLYYGSTLTHVVPEQFVDIRKRGSFSPSPTYEDKITTFDDLPREYPSYGKGDYRVPAVHMAFENGTTINEFVYKDHNIYKGKPALEGLPSTYVENEDEATTLEITIIDELVQLEVVLSYTLFEEYDVITRHVRFMNKGKENIKLQRALSTCVDFQHNDFDLLHLYGSWSRERHIERQPLMTGIQTIDSKRGSSSHQHNPFVALLSKDATEEHGEVYGFNLVYSGNFMADVEVDQFHNTRVAMGINSFDFMWNLEPDNSFCTPECVMVYSNNGLGEMSRKYHKLYRQRLCRGEFRDKTRPILVNNWEATYLDFTEEKLLDIAKLGKEIGMELFVLDDGWFGKRDTDDCSLGDWYINEKKLPNGLGNIAESLKNMDMTFGLWFEPEMVSPDSDLYRAHPDWCLHVPGRGRSFGRQQLILDLSREDVCDYIIDSVSKILSSVSVGYVKWDMNRNMTEIGSALLPAHQQRETAHRYMLGLYRVLETITSNFPHILFESCSGGGGRFDPGMLYYMPQTWTSDDTDAVERLKIQYGTSVVYPISSMGAHISAVPNHIVDRVTPLKTRGDVAMSGNFGYELDLTALSAEEIEEMKIQVEQYKSLRSLIQFGDMYRLKSPFEGNETSWMVVSEDKSEAFLGFFQVLAMSQSYRIRVKLQGLSPEKFYRDEFSGETFKGDYLMNVGINLPVIKGDYKSIIWHLKEVKGRA